MRMRLTIAQSLEYMKDAGYTVSQATYCRMKNKLQSLKLERLYNIAKYGFTDAHLERIDQLELIQKLMWDDYHNCKDPYKRTCILEKIANIQPYLSAYYEATKDVIVKKKQEDDTPKPIQEDISISES
jgi:hypothetical protein